MSDDHDLNKRVRDVEIVIAKTETLLASIEKYFSRLDSNFTAAIQEFRKTEGKVDELERSVAVLNTKVEALNEQLKDSKKLTYKLVAVFMAILMAAAGVKNAPEMVEKMVGVPAVSKSMEPAE